MTEQLSEVFPGYCSHCGGTHSGECGVKAATWRILENYRPRGATGHSREFGRAIERMSGV